ncbi:uncharacterized protein LOC144433243 [Glandiceps talaboti]
MSADNITSNVTNQTEVVNEITNAPMPMMNLPIQLVLVVLALVGFIGNGLVLVVYGRKRRKTSPHYFIMTLAANDLFICVVIVPYFMYSHIVPNFRNATACRIFTYMWFVSIASSILITGVIALDRYYAICRPLDFSFTPKKAKIVVTVCFVVSAAAATPVFFMYGISYRERYGTYIYMCDYVCHPKIDLIFYRTFFALYCCLVSVTLFLYTKIMITVRRKSRLRTQTLGLQVRDRDCSIFSSNMSVFSNGKVGSRRERLKSRESPTMRQNNSRNHSFDSIEGFRPAPSPVIENESESSDTLASLTPKGSIHRVITEESYVTLGNNAIQETKFVTKGTQIVKEIDTAIQKCESPIRLNDLQDAKENDRDPTSTHPRSLYKRQSQASTLSWGDLPSSGSGSRDSPCRGKSGPTTLTTAGL